MSTVGVKGFMVQGIDIEPDYQGKVRDIYDLGDTLLFVASDRISAFDFILPDLIPYKGEILTRVSLFWFELLKDVVGNHLVSADVAALPARFQPYAGYLAGRFMIVKKADMMPVECIVRGYLTGSGLKDYQRTGSVCGVELPAGLIDSSKLPESIYTPSTKAAIGDHDENVSFEHTVELLGVEDATAIRDAAIKIYSTAREYAVKRGIIIADTKFEFGKVNSELILADEVLTPDSSRFWPADSYEPGKSQPSFDKQFIRDWLSAHWDMQGQPPHLPEDVIKATSDKYQQAYELITGKKFVPTVV